MVIIHVLDNYGNYTSIDHDGNYTCTRQQW